MNVRRTAVLIGGLLLALAASTACRSGAPTAATVVTTPTVGGTVETSSGPITFESVTTTIPAGFGQVGPGQKAPTLWMRLRFVNATEDTITIVGFRGAPGPQIMASDGTSVDTLARGTQFTGGSGGFGPGRPEAIFLGPGGRLTGTYGVAPTETQYAKGRRSLTVVWRPAGGEGAKFVLR